MPEMGKTKGHKMKFLITLIIGIFTLNVSHGFDPHFYKDLSVAESELQELSQQEGWAKEILAKQAKRIMHSFMSEKMRSEDIAKEFEIHMSKTNPEDIGDIIKSIQDFIIKIYGSKLGQVIIKVLGFNEVKSSIEDIRNGLLLMRNNVTCEEGFTKMASGISFIVGFVGVYYYMQGNPAAIFIANAGGIIAKEACKIVIDVTDVDKLTCNLIYKRSDFYEVSYSY